MTTRRWFGTSESLFFSLATLLLVACASPPASDATSTTAFEQLAVSTTTVGEGVTVTTEVAVNATTTIETPTSTTAPESISVSAYPESWAQALVDAANQDDFGLLDGYAFKSEEKRNLFRVFVQSDPPKVEVVGSCADTYHHPGCSIASDDGQTYSVGFDFDSSVEEFSDLMVRAANIEDLASDGAHGSGCSPGPGPLPDGIWFGYIAARHNDAIDFDLACLLPNELVDVEMANTSTAVRTLPIEGDVLVTQMLFDESQGEHFDGTLYRDWDAEWCPMTGTCAVWVRVDDGHVTYIAEEFYS